MGTYIKVIVQKRDLDGNYKTLSFEPEWYNYDLFAWIAGVRNEYNITPLSLPRGLPQDLKDYISKQQKEEDEERKISPWFGSSTNFRENLIRSLFSGHDVHSISWLSLQELLGVNYDLEVWDSKRYSLTTGRDYDTHPKQEYEGKSLKQFLGKAFMDDLERFRLARADRIVFGFF